MGRILTGLRFQFLVLEGAGVVPTIPSPSTLTPNDAGWQDTDIMKGELAWNKTDDLWYYRSDADQIKGLGSAMTAAEIRALLVGFTTLTDGATIPWDINNKKEHWAILDTAEAAPTIPISNADAQTVHSLKVKKTIAGDTTITFTGTGYKFVDMANKAAPVASLALYALSGDANTVWEISLALYGDLDGTDLIVDVTVL